jgi:hypothetical protein
MLLSLDERPVTAGECGRDDGVAERLNRVSCRLGYRECVFSRGMGSLGNSNERERRLAGLLGRERRARNDP